MGKTFMDKYSLLHFCVGVIAYFLGIPFLLWILLHMSFEIIENTPVGVYFIDKYLKWFWPGGKREPDTPINILGDNVFAFLGWLTPYFLFGPMK
jgi:hypothetical protein